MDQTEWIRQLIGDNRIHEFYNSQAWKSKKNQVLRDQHYECQRCMAKGKYVRARTVHHKKYLRTRPDLAFDNENLEAICDGCHYDEHHRLKPGFANDERW